MCNYCLLIYLFSSEFILKLKSTNEIVPFQKSTFLYKIRLSVITKLHVFTNFPAPQSVSQSIKINCSFTDFFSFFQSSDFIPLKYDWRALSFQLIRIETRGVYNQNGNRDLRRAHIHFVAITHFLYVHSFLCMESHEIYHCNNNDASNVISITIMIIINSLVWTIQVCEWEC